MSRLVAHVPAGVVLALVVACSGTEQSSGNLSGDTSRAPLAQPEQDPVTPNTNPDDDLIRLRGNIPTHVSGARVVVFNIWKRSYQDAQGATREGITAVFSPLDSDGEQIIGVGSRVTIADTQFDVVQVEASAGGKEPFVILRPAPP